jgi:diaminopimelate decarboxylase
MIACMDSNSSATAELPCGLTHEQARRVREKFKTPCYVYDSSRLKEQADKCLKLPIPKQFGHTVRYAMKANPSRGVLSLFRDLGLHIDASSDYEVDRAILYGFHPNQIQLTSQMPSRRLKEHVDNGVLFNACSLRQLQVFGNVAPGREVSVRINPGTGSGGTKRTTTGGPDSSFGIWYEDLNKIKDIAQKSGLKITRLHTHIGSGADPKSWEEASRMTLDLAVKLPEVRTVNFGGGFKVARVLEEPHDVDMKQVGEALAGRLESFESEHKRTLHLEIEPGGYLVANAGYLVCECVDVVQTFSGDWSDMCAKSLPGSKPSGRIFAKLDAGMPEILRPSLYGAQHPIYVLHDEREERKQAEVIFVGPCCETGDVLTTEDKKPEELKGRRVPYPHIGDLVVIGGAGAYCASMAAINYNSYPQAPEVMLDDQGVLRELRKRQTFDQMLANEWKRTEEAPTV